MKTKREMPESTRNALEAIAGMHITDETDKGQTLAICMAIARIELDKTKEG